jgi:hypothetical protein
MFVLNSSFQVSFCVLEDGVDLANDLVSPTLQGTPKIHFIETPREASSLKHPSVVNSLCRPNLRHPLHPHLSKEHFTGRLLLEARTLSISLHIRPNSYFIMQTKRKFLLYRMFVMAFNVARVWFLRFLDVLSF